MKNKASAMNKSNQNIFLHWLSQDTQDDDFLSDKSPSPLEFTLEDEE
jgi:hypothetical protein